MPECMTMPFVLESYHSQACDLLTCQDMTWEPVITRKNQQNACFIHQSFQDRTKFPDRTCFTVDSSILGGKNPQGWVAAHWNAIQAHSIQPKLSHAADGWVSRSYARGKIVAFCVNVKVRTICIE